LFDVVKVVDFGLVKEVAGDAQASSVIAGTPHFIAPESILDPATAGPASDLYSLGATAYTLLTGRKVFEGRTVVELYAQHATAEPKPPGGPGELEALVMACLAKDPAARPASAGALRRALDALACDDWDDARAEAWWRDLETAALETSIDPGVSSPTMTVDLRARQPARTDQDT
jgi:serine/threonine-protein kinase